MALRPDLRYPSHTILHSRDGDRGCRAGPGYGGLTLGLVTGGAIIAGQLASSSIETYLEEVRTTARLQSATGERLDVTEADIAAAQLFSDGSGSVLRIPYRDPQRLLGWRDALWPVWIYRTFRSGPNPYGSLTAEITGEAAVRAAGVILPTLNRFSGGERRVQDAVQFLERAGGVEECFAAASEVPRTLRKGNSLSALPAPVRLALEMAAHEESERVALEGELAQLEAAWREAEEIAAIADNLLLPPRIQALLERHRSSATDA